MNTRNLVVASISCILHTVALISVIIYFRGKPAVLSVATISTILPLAFWIYMTKTAYKVWKESRPK